MDEKKLDFWLSILLVFYLLATGIGAALGVIGIFPPRITGEPQFPFPLDLEKGFLLLAFLAGAAGSFLHAAQSLSSYIGNRAFKASWAAWYFLRPWVGGVLGLAIYFVLRAGLVGGASVINPYGVVALGILSGWFSKTATDKLKQVFETLFATDEDKKRMDKLVPQPVVERTDPPQPIPVGTAKIQVFGQDFMEGAQVTIDGKEVGVRFVSETQLEVVLSSAAPVNLEALLVVKNPNGTESAGFVLRFA